MSGVFLILLWHYVKKVCPHFLLSLFEWAWENETYSLNNCLNTNKLYQLLTLKDQRPTWHYPKDRFARDSALRTKQDMHEINTALSLTKSLVKSAHHREPKGFCSSSAGTSIAKKKNKKKTPTTAAFHRHRVCLTQHAVFSWARKQPWFHSCIFGLSLCLHWKSETWFDWHKIQV